MAARCMWKRYLLPAAGFANASGMVTAGASAASRSATDLISANSARLDLETRPKPRPGFFCSHPRTDLRASLRAKRSNTQAGLLRRFAPRNDEEMVHRGWGQYTRCDFSVPR